MSLEPAAPAGVPAAAPAAGETRSGTAAAPAEVVTIGECLVALIAANAGPLADQGRFVRNVAGAEANLAVGLARLGHRVAFVGRVGDDGFGTAIVRRLRGEGVDVDLLRVEPGGRTGLLVRELRALGSPEVIYHRSGSAGSRVGRDDVVAASEAIRAARRLHLTGITPSLSPSARAATELAAAIAREAGVPVSLDLNLRRRLWDDAEAAAVLRPLVAGLDLVMASPDEAAAIAGGDPDDDPVALAGRLRALGATTAVVKLGVAGSLVLGPDGAPVARPGLPVTAPLDPVGAGDAFAAGLLAALLEGLPPATALDWGNACGAAVVATVGDLAGLPTRPELERLLALRGPSGPTSMP